MNAGMKGHDQRHVEVPESRHVSGGDHPIILRCTWNSAHEIKHEELGQLSTGAPADVSVLPIEKGRFSFLDSLGARMEGHRKFECELTVSDGLVEYDANGI